MPYKGIYYIDGISWFPTQIIVTKELPAQGHTWIKSLSSKMKMPDMKRLLNETVKLKSEYEKELADSVLEVALKANKVLVEKLRGEVDMSGALQELLEPLIQNQVQNRIQDQQHIWLQKAIKCTVDALRSFGHNNEEIKISIMKNYNLSEEAAEKCL